MKKTLSLFLVLGIATASVAQNIDTFFAKADTFLKKNVSSNKVYYQNVKDDLNNLNEILEIAAKVDISKADDNTTKAFWINAYNLSVIKGIALKFPVKSPMDIGGFFDKNTYTVAGKKTTLNDIENKMLRAKFNDARFHFVLVCGAVGCPPIINAAYLPSTLDAQLDKQATVALNNPNFIKVNAASNKVELSQIFEWYKTDFIVKGKNEIDYINQYRESKINSKSKISYYTYDWTLNKAK